MGLLTTLFYYKVFHWKPKHCRFCNTRRHRRRVFPVFIMLTTEVCVVPEWKPFSDNPIRSSQWKPYQVITLLHTHTKIKPENLFSCCGFAQLLTSQKTEKTFMGLCFASTIQHHLVRLQLSGHRDDGRSHQAAFPFHVRGESDAPVQSFRWAPFGCKPRQGEVLALLSFTVHDVALP